MRLGVWPGTLQPQPPSSLLLLPEAGTQLLLESQTLPGAQSSTLVHSDLQLPLEASHTYGTQSVETSSSVIDELKSSEHLEPVGLQLSPSHSGRAGNTRDKWPYWQLLPVTHAMLTQCPL